MIMGTRTTELNISRGNSSSTGSWKGLDFKGTPARPATLQVVAYSNWHGAWALQECSLRHNISNLALPPWLGHNENLTYTIAYLCSFDISIQ